MTIRARFISRTRGAACALLLGLLAVCGYAGAQREPARTVSVDVTRAVFMPEADVVSGVDAASRLHAQREQEIDMLREVADSDAASAKTREDALRQLTQIAERMETEAQAQACLENMGFSDTAAVCGAQMITVITPYQNISKESDKARLIDAVSSLTGYEPGDIKIILTKK